MRGRGLALPVVLGTLVASGCGGDSPPDSVAVRDFEFEPADYTTEAGQRVTWTNDGEQIHNVKGRGFFSRAMEAGDTYEFTFEKPGSYDYVCTLHPQMKGTIVVE
jgi:plastocyanin